MLLAMTGAGASAQQPVPFPNVGAVVQAARADAQKRLAAAGAAPAIELLSAEAVTWSDGSLGCPRPGMGYTQALVNGYRVQLKVGDEVWDYHATRRGALLLCPEGRARAPRPSSTN